MKKKLLLVITVLLAAFTLITAAAFTSRVEASKSVEVVSEVIPAPEAENSVEAFQRYYYGALAIDGNKGRGYGFAVNYSTQSAADSYALNQCGYGCQVVIRFYNTCAAYAADQARGSTVYGWSQGNTGPSARIAAINQCRNRGGRSCVVRVWGCTNRR